MNRTDASYEAAMRRLAAYEDDFRRYEEENRHQPTEWWDDAKLQVRRSLREMRLKFDELKDKAPDAWGEMKDGIGHAMAIIAPSESSRTSNQPADRCH